MPTQRSPPWPDFPCTLPFWYLYLSVSFFGRHRLWLARLAIGGAYSCHHYASLTHSSILCLHGAVLTYISCHWLGLLASLSHASTQGVPSNTTNVFFELFKTPTGELMSDFALVRLLALVLWVFFLSSASPGLQPYQCLFHFEMRFQISDAAEISAAFSGEDRRFRMVVTWLRAKQLIGGFRPNVSSQTKYFLHTWRLAPVPPLSAQIPINKISNFNILVCW